MEHPDADSGVAALAVGSLIDRRHQGPGVPPRRHRPDFTSEGRRRLGQSSRAPGPWLLTVCVVRAAEIDQGAALGRRSCRSAEQEVRVTDDVGGVERVRIDRVGPILHERSNVIVLPSLV